MRKLLFIIGIVVVFGGIVKTTDINIIDSKIKINLGLSNGSEIKKDIELPKVNIKFGEE